MKISVRDNKQENSHRGNGKYAEWSNHKSYDIEGLEISDTSWSDLETSFDVLPNKDYYLLYAVYGTGDSFGRSSGKLEYIYLYEDENIAKQAAKLIDADYTKYCKEKGDSFASVTIPVEDNKTLKLSCCWKGYFERLEELCVKPIRLIGSESDGRRYVYS